MSALRSTFGAFALLVAACGTSSSGGDAGLVVGDTGADATGGSGDASADSDAGVDAVVDAAVDAAPDAPVAPDDRDDGDECVADVQCASGTCAGERDGFPGGYCTALPCESRRDCTGNAACLRGEFNGNLCVELCADDDDCRPGYRCRVAGTAGYCYPDVAGAALGAICESSRTDGLVESPYGTRDFGVREVRFDLSDEATGFFFVAWSDDGRLYPSRFTFADGDAMELDDYAQYAYTPLSFERLAPVLFPAGPQFRDLMAPGEVVVEVAWEQRDEGEFCWAVVENTDAIDPGAQVQTIDLNLYLVGIPGLSAATAATDADFAEVLEELGRVYGQAGVRVGDVRYLDVSGDVAERFTVIRDQDEVYELVKLSRQPGPMLDELLSVNVFFIQGFGGEMGGTLGISTGIPGAAGLHGSVASGLVFSASSLGRSSGNRNVGQTLAHEIGHYLGLFHTTELRNLGRDHLDDTPECPDIGGGGNANCPDIVNLMFPIANYRSEVGLSEGQSLILRANPLTRAEE